MLATIELPNNKTELDFVLEVLKRLNVRVIRDDETTISDDVLEEHAAILRARRQALSEPNAQFFSWEEAQLMLANRKQTPIT